MGTILGDALRGVKETVSGAVTLDWDRVKAGGTKLAEIEFRQKEEIRKELQKRVNDFTAKKDPLDVLNNAKRIFQQVNKRMYEDQIDVLDAMLKAGRITPGVYASRKSALEKKWLKKQQPAATKSTAQTTTMGVDIPVILNEIKTSSYTKPTYLESGAPSKAMTITPSSTGLNSTTMVTKILSFVKTYWYIVVLVAFGVWYVFLRKKRKR